MRSIYRFFLKWRWEEKGQCWRLRPFWTNHAHATVWPNGVWHTWDENGVGGENSICEYKEFIPFEQWHFDAKREAWESCEKQGFI